MASRITKEWRLEVGRTADGRKEEVVIGWEVEDDFGGGNKTTRFKVDLSCLNPQLFTLVRSIQPPNARSAFGYATRHDVSRRVVDRSAPPPEDEVAEANGNGAASGGGDG